MKFDFCIGNPPYQQEQESANSEGSLKNFAPPVYNLFIDAATEVAEKVELIHPARFLFNAGSTPKAWNEKMLNDEHFKVLKYEPDSDKVFPGLSTPIKGGIAITYHDKSKAFGAIQAFAQYPEANTVAHKVTSRNDFISLSNIIYSRTAYRLTEALHKDFPNVRYKEDENGNNVGRLSKGHDYDMASNIFERLPMVFKDKKPTDSDSYIRILGREDNKRIYKWIERKYVNTVDNLEYYKVLIPQANGNGSFGETISNPIVEVPGVGNTETFISIGKFSTESEANSASLYIKTKFARMLLSVLKVTQNGNKPVWKMIPLQDFSSQSDIDWRGSISDIDKQLYAKYGLSQEEIDFIEENVKEMA